MIKSSMTKGAFALVLPFALLSCAQGPEPGPPPRIENPALAVSFGSPTEAFVLETNVGETFSFTPASEGESPVAGRAWVAVSEPQGSAINLVEITNSQKGLFEALPGGEFFGSRELVTHLGPAYYSRGRFDEEGGRVEEIRVNVLHPTERNRLLTLHYRYPAAEDSAQRLQSLLGLLGEIEGLEDSTVEENGESAVE